jgi:N-methylhydantoinase A
VTDAHVVRGTIRAEAFLGGTMRLDPARAHAAFAPIAARLGTDIQGAAAASIRLAVANIVRAIQLVSTERGRDPRDYALLPFGGAGPLLAAEIAEELNIREILVPPNPGVISALGLVAADYALMRGVTRRAPLDAEAPALLRADFTRFRDQARAEFRALGLDGPASFSLNVDMRFVGQAFEVPVDLDPADLADLTAADLADRFDAAHRRVYQHGGEAGRRVEIVGLRCGIRRPQPVLEHYAERPAMLIGGPESRVRVGAETLPTRLHAASALTQADTIEGPAMIEGYSATTWVPPGWLARRDQAGNIRMRRTA